jgi:hypothetical protein
MEQVFSEEQNGEIIARAVNSLRRGEGREQSRENLSHIDPETMAEQIRQIMLKYYPEPKSISNSLFEFILLMLAAPSDEILLGLINNIFFTVSEVEKVYLSLIEEKERLFK